MNPEARRSLIDRRLFTLRPKTLRAYMLARGWRDYPHPYTPFMVREDYRSDDTGDYIPLMVPTNNKFGDLGQRTVELLRGLSDMEERPAMDILEDMLALQAATPANGSAPKNGPAATPQTRPASRRPPRSRPAPGTS